MGGTALLQGLPELPQQLLLLLSQAHRRLHLYPAHQVTGRAAAHWRYAFAAQPEQAPALSFGRNLQLHTTGQRRNFNLATKRRIDEGYRHLTIQIATFTGEDRMLTDHDLHVQVTRWPVVEAGLAFAGQPYPVTGIHTRRHLHRQRLAAFDAALTTTAPTRILDDLAGAPTARAGLLQREKALCHPHLAHTVAIRAGDRTGALARARTVTVVTGLGNRYADLDGVAGYCLLEVELEVIAQIGATLYGTARAAAAEDVSEHIAEDIREVAGTGGAKAPGTHTIGINASMAEAVWAGERRPQGHFLPCVLAAQGAFDLARHPVWRIQRIAVHPHWQGRGLGQRLLHQITERARAEGIGMVGASFGLDPDLLGLWKRGGFDLLRAGLRPDPYSGRPGGVVLKAVDDALAGPIRCLAAAQARDWPAWRDRLWPWHETALARALEALFPEAGPDPAMTKDLAELKAFAERARPLEWVLPALVRQLRAQPPTDTEGTVLATALEPPIDWDDLAVRLGVSGRRGVVRRLRQAAQAWRTRVESGGQPPG